MFSKKPEELSPAGMSRPVASSGSTFSVIGSDVTATARAVLDRMLSAGGEMVTLVLGDEAPPPIVPDLETHVRESYLAVDTVVYRGGRQGALLLIGVE